MLVAGEPFPFMTVAARDLVLLFLSLFAVPGGSDGPSGVLVCCENYILYKNLQDQPDIRCPIPQRQNDLDDAERSMLIVCSSMHKTKVSERHLAASIIINPNIFPLLS